MVFLHSLLLAAFIAAHPLHVSLTSVEINTGEKTISITHKFYTNDFNLLFYHLFEQHIEPQSDREFNTAEAGLIKNYMDHRFTLVQGNDTIALTYLRKEQNDESLWLFYSGEIKNAKIKTLTINNLLFLDLYEDQKNLVIVTRGLRENGLTFDYETQRSEVAIGDE